MDLLGEALKETKNKNKLGIIRKRDPEIDTALAFVDGDVSAEALAKVRKTSRAACYYWLGGVLTRAIRGGALVVSDSYKKLPRSRT